jgi:FKBP12-rapamycin complex-associated protein
MFLPFTRLYPLLACLFSLGIEGNFRSTCESVMRVLRGNRESVMAVLEAFVYDPLINWRLLKTTKTTLHGETKEGDEEGKDGAMANMMATGATGIESSAVGS